LRQAALQRLTVAALGPSTDAPGWVEYLDSLQSNKLKKAAELALKTRKKIAETILKNVFGQHVVNLVWFHVNQGPNPRGCFGSTSVDPMHAFEEGIVPNIMSVILDPLSESAKSSLDALAINIISCNRWDPEYPRMNFSGGFCSLTQLTADEKVGKMILLWIIMQTPLGRDIVDKRCNSSFDAQRLTRAARFASNPLQYEDEDEDDNDLGSTDSDTHVGTTSATNRTYTGSTPQVAVVNQCLRMLGLEYVEPWIQEMIPFHQENLRRVVFQIHAARGKGHNHTLPSKSFLDRYEVCGEVASLYCDENVQLQDESTDVAEARCSVDCTLTELQVLLEMLLSFHAFYKYAPLIEKVNFDKNVRLMMRLVKERIHRGRETKNWSISKFHELLHMSVDARNFGSHANIDAGKGEHGLKKWAKLPSKTVRTRDANHYYHDMAVRIHENRLIELATSTLMPRSRGEQADPTRRPVGTGKVTIALVSPLMQLDVVGPSLPLLDLTAFLRNRPNLSFPIDIFQEAKYSVDGGMTTTIRGTHNYRNSGPWYDCVYVVYEDDSGEMKEYPFQVHGFFVEARKDTRSAVGKMGLQKKSTSQLLDEWTYERNFRIIDLETVSRAVYALTIPASCYKEDGGSTPYRMFVLKDRITEWPALFNKGDWSGEDKNRKKRKRKTNR
jgi:hypothetical protein